MATFPRTLAPNRVEFQTGRSPLVSATQGNVLQVRSTLSYGVRWTEEWPILDLTGATARAFLAQLMRWHRLGTQVDLVPWSHQTALGTAAQGAAGAVNGASQSGSSLVTDGWGASVTFKQGDYLKIAGLPSLWLAADATADGAGNATFTIDPPIPAGSEPADSATVTLNGSLGALIVDPPVVPATVAQTEYYAGLAVGFREVW